MRMVSKCIVYGKKTQFLKNSRIFLYKLFLAIIQHAAFYN